MAVEKLDQYASLGEYREWATRRIRELERENMRLRQCMARNESHYRRLQTQLSSTKSVE